jgi:hypothetical protein
MKPKGTIAVVAFWLIVIAMFRWPSAAMWLLLTILALAIITSMSLLIYGLVEDI